MKGRVEFDVALEAARQCWGAHELLIRLGFSQSELTIKPGRMVDTGGSGALQLHATVQISGKAKPFYLDCGPIPSVKLLGDAVRRCFARIASGEVSEAQLHREFHATNAWIGREQIVGQLQAMGYAVNLSALTVTGPN